MPCSFDLRSSISVTWISPGRFPLFRFCLGQIISRSEFWNKRIFSFFLWGGVFEKKCILKKLIIHRKIIVEGPKTACLMHIFEIYISFFEKLKLIHFWARYDANRGFFYMENKWKLIKKWGQLRKLRFWIIAFVIMTNLFNQAPTHSEWSLKAHRGS